MSWNKVALKEDIGRDCAEDFFRLDPAETIQRWSGGECVYVWVLIKERVKATVENIPAVKIYVLWRPAKRNLLSLPRRSRACCP